MIGRLFWVAIAMLNMGNAVRWFREDRPAWWVAAAIVTALVCLRLADDE